MIMSHGYNAAAIPAGYPVAGGYGHHPHQQLQQYHPAHLHYSAAAAQDAGPQPKVEPGAAPASPSAGASDPFSPSGCSFGAEDEFDVPPLPPTAMEDPPQPPPPTQAQHYYGAQQSMYPMNSYYGAQQQQQGGYSQYDQYAYAGGYGVYGGHHQQQQQHQGGVVLPGGPSPGGGSHNTPSPQAHSEDGDHDHVRNNNIIKTEAAVGAEGMRHGGMIGYAQHAAHHLIARKPKVSKRKKKRDPNEPQKPVSAYALFFRDTQAGIKQRNPNAAFGDVSKVVASMWDNLDPDSKAAYKKRTEMAKKEYLKKLAAYRASLISKGGLDGLNPYAPYASSYAEIAAMKGGYLTSAAGGGYLHGGQPIPPRPPMQQQPQHMGAPSALPSVERNHPGYMMQQHHNYNSQMSNGIQARPNSPSSQHSQHSPTATGDCRTSNGHLAVAASNGGSANAPITTMADSGATTTTTSSVSGAAAPNGGGCGVGGESRRCGRPSCGSVSASGAAEFCSSECVVGQCREVYTNWSGASNGQQQQQQQSAPRSEYSPRVAK